MLKQDVKEKILAIQKSEITEHIIYKKLSSILNDKTNKELLETISKEELAHYDFWQSLTQQNVTPDKLKIFFYILINRVFGITFGIKLMEISEGLAQKSYALLKEISPRVEQIISDEDRHEHQLIGLIDEERLKYISSMVLGLNDALVELTGAGRFYISFTEHKVSGYCWVDYRYCCVYVYVSIRIPIHQAGEDGKKSFQGKYLYRRYLFRHGFSFGDPLFYI